MAEEKARKRKLPRSDTSNTASNVRPATPKQLERDVLVEAGHRCAIPTCKQTPVQIAHIIPWETVLENRSRIHVERASFQNQASEK